MTVLRVTWRPADQAALLRRDAARGGPGMEVWAVLAAGLALAPFALLAPRLAVWALHNVRDPAPLLAPLGGPDLAAAGAMLGVALLGALLVHLGGRLLLAGALEARREEGREPLLGPVTVALDPARVTLRGEGWEGRYDAALVTGLDEVAGMLVLRLGPGRNVPLPLRDLTGAEAAAVRGWAAAAMAAR